MKAKFTESGPAFPMKDFSKFAGAAHHNDGAQVDRRTYSRTSLERSKTTHDMLPHQGHDLWR